MDIRSLLGVIAVFIISSKSIAEVQLGRLIKEQRNNDNTSYQESKIDKSDVFSDIKNETNADNEFPQENPCYQINELILLNDFLNNTSTHQIKEIIAGKCLGIKGIEKAAIRIQDSFIRAGYVTTRVETPTQDLSSKKLILNIIPGRIANVIVATDDVNTALLPFASGDVLNLRDIEQGLENLQRNPGVDVKINIIPGEVSGTSNIELNPRRTTSWNLRTSYNNYGDKFTGKQLINASGYLYNISKMSDLFYLAGTTSQTGAYKNFSTHYSVPVGYTDLSLFYSNSKTTQGIDIGKYVFDYEGKTEYFSLKGYRVLRRDANSKLSASAEFIRRKYDYTLGGTELVLQNRDMGNYRLGLHYKHNYNGATLDSSLTWQRFITALGGEKTPDMKNGDVSSQSQIVNLNVNYIKWLTSQPIQAYYNLNLGVQYAPDNLTLQDKFTVGNRWSVRGFENSSGIDGDNGFYVQNTFNINTGFNNATSYFGADFGQITSNVSPQDIGGKKLLGGIIGLKGSVKAFEYDVSLSSPFIYPKKMDVDRYTINFNLGYLL